MESRRGSWLALALQVVVVGCMMVVMLEGEVMGVWLNAGPQQQGGAKPIIDNPFLNPVPAPPPYRIPNMDGMQAWNRYEIPEFPKRFVVDFIWRRAGDPKPIGGSWIYNYVERKELIRYMWDKKWVKGYFYNYQIRKERLRKYETGGPKGEVCDEYDLRGPYHRMFSPRSWRRINLDSVVYEKQDFYEEDRSDAVLGMRGVWNDSAFSLHTYTNGTFRSISVNDQTWHFFNMRDYDEIDNYAARNNKYIQLLHAPLEECPYAGEMTASYAAVIQPYAPFPLVKPKQPERQLTAAEKKGRT